MGSGAGGLGPVASEPGKGSFPLPFLLPRRGAGALTEQIRAEAGRRGRGCCFRRRLSVAARNPSDRLPPDPLPISQYSPNTSLGLHLRPLPYCLGLCLGSHAAAQSAPSPLPKSSAHWQPWSTFGQPSLASPVTIGCSLSLSPSPGRQSGYSPGPRRMGVPHCFRGSSPAPAPGPPGMAPLHALPLPDVYLGPQSC